jgi:hypothetical protein
MVWQTRKYKDLSCPKRRFNHHLKQQLSYPDYMKIKGSDSKLMKKPMVLNV